jgi:hypothetical protein
MKRKLPDVSSREGSQMGRRSVPATDKLFPHKMYLVKLKWVDGDYDEGGAYWGNNCNGASIYWAYGEDDQIRFEYFVRAMTRAQAKWYVKKEYPNAKFYR